jgi:hypothetical protein
MMGLPNMFLGNHMVPPKQICTGHPEKEEGSFQVHRLITAVLGVVQQGEKEPSDLPKYHCRKYLIL